MRALLAGGLGVFLSFFLVSWSLVQKSGQPSSGLLCRMTSVISLACRGCGTVMFADIIVRLYISEGWSVAAGLTFVRESPRLRTVAIRPKRVLLF